MDSGLYRKGMCAVLLFLLLYLLSLIIMEVWILSLTWLWAVQRTICKYTSWGESKLVI